VPPPFIDDGEAHSKKCADLLLKEYFNNKWEFNHMPHPQGTGSASNRATPPGEGCRFALYYVSCVRKYRLSVPPRSYRNALVRRVAAVKICVFVLTEKVAFHLAFVLELLDFTSENLRIIKFVALRVRLHCPHPSRLKPFHTLPRIYLVYMGKIRP
jgi:hypothetical protein